MLMDISLLPITSLTHMRTSQVARHVDSSVTLGAKMLVGGPVDHEINSTGATFYKPTVLVDMTEEMIPFHEETFGPVASLMKFQKEEEAIAIANNTKYVYFTQKLMNFALLLSSTKRNTLMTQLSFSIIALIDLV